jgi:predicted lactoylglutathione lyase
MPSMAITQISFTTNVIVTDDDISVYLKTSSFIEVMKVSEEVVIMVIKTQMALKEKAYSMLTCFIQRCSLAFL